MAPIARADIEHVLAHTGAVWPSLRGARVFVTGGTGFVGKWLLETVVAANEKLGLGIATTVLTRDIGRFTTASPHFATVPGLSFIEGDIRDFAWPGGDYSHIVHAATDMAAGVSALHMFDVIVEGTRRVLDFAVQSQATKTMIVSSGAVYGRQPAELPRILENHAGLPGTPYGRGKRAAEWLASAHAAEHGLHSTVARLFALTGPCLPLDASYAAGNFVADALARRPIAVGGDGTTLRSYLYAADMAIWLWTILARGQPGTAYNVGSEEQVSIADLARRVAALAPTPVPVEIARSPEPGKAAERYIPSTALARETLELAERIPLDEGLRRMMAWNRGELY